MMRVSGEAHCLFYSVGRIFSYFICWKEEHLSSLPGTALEGRDHSWRVFQAFVIASEILFRVLELRRNIWLRCQEQSSSEGIAAGDFLKLLPSANTFYQVTRRV